MWENLGVTPVQTAELVLSVVGIYLTLLLLIRVLGQRSMSSMSGFDLAAIITFGSVAGRSILGYTPTMAAGMVALVTLFGIQAVLGQVRRTRRGDRLVTNQPVLLMAGSEMITENMKRSHIVVAELRSKLRGAGVRNLSEVACVVLERNGSISVVRRGVPIDPDLLADVRGGELVPAELVGHDEGRALEAPEDHQAGGSP